MYYQLGHLLVQLNFKLLTLCVPTAYHLRCTLWCESTKHNRRSTKFICTLWILFCSVSSLCNLWSVVAVPFYEGTIFLIIVWSTQCQASFFCCMLVQAYTESKKQYFRVRFLYCMYTVYMQYVQLGGREGKFWKDQFW